MSPPTADSAIRDNHFCGNVGDFLKPHLKGGSTLSVVSKQTNLLDGKLYHARNGEADAAILCSSSFTTRGPDLKTARRAVLQNPKRFASQSECDGPEDG